MWAWLQAHDSGEIMATSIHAELTPTLDSASEDTPLYPHKSGHGRLAQYMVDVASRSRDIIVSIIACLGAMSMGFSLGYSSPALEDKHLMKMLNTHHRRSWFGSLLTIGAMVGGPVGAVLVSRLGRKTTLILCNVPLAVGWFLIIYATNVVLLYTGRY